MSLIIETVTEDSFYDNLTLGIVDVLAKIPGIQDVVLEKRMPCDRHSVNSWEQRNDCALPEDLKQFYLSTDGFKLEWNYNYAGSIRPLGSMFINPLSEVQRLVGTKPAEDSDEEGTPSASDIDGEEEDTEDRTKDIGVKKGPDFGPRCKTFELDASADFGKVCLVYLEKEDAESDTKKIDCTEIWLLDRTFQWHFLTETFTKYFRMMLVHHGLPQWQSKFTPMGLSPYAHQYFLLIAPHLIHQDTMYLDESREWIDPTNSQLDPSIFKVRSKSSKREKSTESSKQD